jgi:cell division protein FtsB
MLKALRQRLRTIWGPLIALGVVFYFGYHTIEGDRGVLAYLSLKAKLDEAELQLAKVTTDRQELEHRVLLLRPDHLDPDMLEERARIMLNMGRDGEQVIIENSHH